MANKSYYDGTKLLSMLDINGRKPELFLCTTNRSGGKTTWFNRLLVNRFKKKGEKFGLIYRFNYELDDCADKFFKDIGSLFFTGSVMTSKRKASGIYHELYLDGDSCGYALSLNNADMLKKYSHMFSDIKSMVFDEFQSETNHYCPDEVKKYISIHTSIARGQGEHVRYVPVYMLSNPVSIINPYYIELGITSRLQSDTKFLRGDGFVLEQGFNEIAASSQKESGFNRAFSRNKYVSYATENVYLNDSTAFIEKPAGNSRYICTIKYMGNTYGIREYAERGILFVDDKADGTYPIKITTTTDDHQINYVMLKRHDMFINTLRNYFEKGCFRFKDLRAKEALLSSISY